MSTKTDKILAVMNVIAWIAVFGFIIKAGAIIVSYAVSINNPEGSKNLYMGLNWYNLRQYDFWYYTGTITLIVAVLILEAYIAYLITRVLSKIKMSSPFKPEISRILERTSYMILFTWIVAMFHNGNLKWLSKKVDGLQENLISGEFLLLGGVVFVIAQIFKKGVEIQTENELTV